MLADLAITNSGTTQTKFTMGAAGADNAVTHDVTVTIAANTIVDVKLKVEHLVDQGNTAIGTDVADVDVAISTDGGTNFGTFTDPDNGKCWCIDRY